MWTFNLPPLVDRADDLPAQIDNELQKWRQRSGSGVIFNVAAREEFEAFAAKAFWPNNFRDLDAAITRMATLAADGRITRDSVREETKRLESTWRPPTDVVPTLVPMPLDRFDHVQLVDVVAVCRRARSLSDAGRTLFSESRTKKAKPNDADRLRKYLARFGLDWARVRESA